LRPYQPPTGLPGERPQASTVPLLGWFLLVGVAQRHPVAALLQHRVQVVDAAEVVAELRRADLDDQGRRVGVLVAPRLELRLARRRAQDPRITGGA
jgi:hypothetical protein